VRTAGFFDRQQASDQLTPSLLFRLLRRFEVRRVDTAAAMLPRGGALLDVGCGDGELERQVSNRHTRIVAVDVAPAVVAEAARNTQDLDVGGGITFSVIDANQRLPFADGEFDALVTLSTLQYLFDPEAFLAEAHRVIRPGGHLLVEVPNVAFLPQRIRLLFGYPIRTSYWKHGIDGGNLHYFTVSVLLRLLDSSGFNVQVVTGSGIFASIRTWWVTLLCGNIFVLARRAFTSSSGA
jgi:SAM-dependent methyltransferase